MSACTKGPWEVSSYRNFFGFSIWSPHGPCIAERWYDHKRSSQENEVMAANARLIAAAPELLEALKEVTYNYMQHVGSEAFSVIQATRAIAKAEGK